MKKLMKLLIAVLLCSFSISSIAQFNATQKTICDIVSFPIDEMDVITVGIVTDTQNDKFDLTYDGCTVLCDGDFGYTPIVGMLIVVEGRVQEEDLFEDLTINVRYWIPYEEEPPDPSDPVVFTVEDALDADEGTVALLFGHVLNYSDEGDGLGTFVDETPGSLFIDFPDGDSPAVQENVYVLGVMELNNAENPILSVTYWYPEGGNPPPPPPPIAWTVDEAETLPLGTFCFISGWVTTWYDNSLGQGLFYDEINSIEIDFEDGVELPRRYQDGYALGRTEENSSSDKFINAYVFLETEADIPITICDIVNFPIDGVEIFTVGTVTEIIDNDEFTLTYDGCSVACDGEAHNMPWIGFDILITGVIEYEQLGNDLEIDIDRWQLTDDGGDPPPEPPPAVFTAEDAISSGVGTVALLNGEITAYVDEVTGLASFTDPTGSINMDFKNADKPELAYPIHVYGVVEYGSGGPNQVDVSSWYYEEEPPPPPEPIGRNVNQLDSLEYDARCFVYGVLTSWSDENEGEGIFEDYSGSITIDFEDDIETLPKLNDSIFILAAYINYNGEERLEAHLYYQPITLHAPTLISICNIASDPMHGQTVITIGQVKEITDDQFVVEADDCEVLCNGSLGNIPEINADIFLAGIVEVNELGDAAAIDVEYWAEYGSDPTPTPVGISSTVEEALNAEDGDWVLVSGNIDVYTNLKEGIGIFVDLTGSIRMDFRADEPPIPGQLTYVLGVIEEVDGIKEIDAVYSYFEGPGIPPLPPQIASTVMEADTLPLNSYCYVLGSITSWIDEIEGKANFNDGNNSIEIDFEDDIDLFPEIDDSFFILGLTSETGDEKSTGINVYNWVGESIESVDDSHGLTSVNIQIFPNPTSNILYISSKVPVSKIRVYDIKGNLVEEYSGIRNSTINVSALKSGIYIISFIDENEYLGSKRLVIE